MNEEKQIFKEMYNRISHKYKPYDIDCPQRLWERNTLLNCPSDGEEELEKITREYMKIQEKINELPPEKEYLKRILEYKKELLCKEISQLFKSEEE